MKLSAVLLLFHVGSGHATETEDNQVQADVVVPTESLALFEVTTDYQGNSTDYFEDDHHEDDNEYSESELDGERLTKGKKSSSSTSKKENNNKKDSGKPTSKPTTVYLPDPILGDEPEGRGQHRCGNVPIPPIVCVDGRCPQGFPKYDRPCNNPMALRGKFKCRVKCGPGWKVSSGSPKKMKCLGKEGKPGYFKVRPKTFGHRIECVKKR